MNESDAFQAIIRYLLKNPGCGDTLEGITEWWVGRELAALKIEEVQRVVAYLCSKSILIERSFPNSKNVYFVNKEKLGLLAKIPGDKLTARDLPRN